MKRIAISALLIFMLIFVLVGCSQIMGTETPSETPSGTETSTELPSTGTAPPTNIDNYINEYYATSVEVTDPLGNSFSDNGSGNLLAILLKMTKNAERSVYLGIDVDASKFYKAVFSGPAGEVEYKFYFTSSPDNCYFESGSGRYYKSNKDGCTEFFNSEYSEGAYALAKYPELSINSKTVIPTEVNWQYKRFDGVYKTPDKSPEIGGEFDVGSIAANIKFVFSTEPTSVTVTVTDASGNQLYSGAQSGLANISLNGEIDAKITVNAKWEKTAEAICSGSATYVIKAKLGPSAVFSVDRTTAKLGEFIVLSCPNTSIDLEGIVVATEPQIDYQSVFFSDGTQIKALLPIPLMTTVKDDIFTVSITAYENTQTFYINIEERKDVSNFTASMITKEILDTVGVTADPYKRIYADIKSELTKNTTFSRIYKHEGFDLGYDQTLRARFGDNVRYSPLGKDKVFVSHDYSWVGTYRNDIKAVSDGRVVYSGEHEYTGGLVIVDHGMGLLSWYWNLNTTSVKVAVGEEIKQGTVIGNNRGGGLTEVYNSTNISVHIALTVFDVPVDIAQLLAE